MHVFVGTHTVARACRLPVTCHVNKEEDFVEVYAQIQFTRQVYKYICQMLNQFSNLK
jgi:hypothetical protein